MNQWLECIDIWYGASLGQGDSTLLKSLGSCMPQGLKHLHSDIHE